MMANRPVLEPADVETGKMRGGTGLTATRGLSSQVGSLARSAGLQQRSQLADVALG